MVSIVAGLLAAAMNGMTATRYFDIVLASLTFKDAWLTVAKGMIFGIVVGVVPSFHGLAVGKASTEVPVAASRGVVVSLLAIFFASGLFVLVAA